MVEQLPDYFVFDEEKVMEYLDKITEELEALDALNKSEKDRTYNSIKAGQYAAYLADEVPVLMSKVKAFKNSIGLYNFYRARLGKDSK
jgi:hypothetical protein